MENPQERISFNLDRAKQGDEVYMLQIETSLEMRFILVDSPFGVDGCCGKAISDLGTLDETFIFTPMGEIINFSGYQLFMRYPPSSEPIIDARSYGMGFKDGRRDFVSQLNEYLSRSQHGWEEKNVKP